MALVHTAVGELDETTLDVQTSVVEDSDMQWVVVRRVKYNGDNPSVLKAIAEHPKVVDGVIRQDVWVTFKRGKDISAEQGL